MLKTLAIGDNAICELTPGKRYALHVAPTELDVFNLKPAMGENGLTLAYFPAAADSTDIVSWNFPGDYEHAGGFEFVAIFPQLVLVSDGVSNVIVNCHPIVV